MSNFTHDNPDDSIPVGFKPSKEDIQTYIDAYNTPDTVEAMSKGVDTFTIPIIKQALSTKLSQKGCKLMDVGTGHGDIPLALAQDYPGLDIVLNDINPDGLLNASSRFAEQSIPVTIIPGDMHSLLKNKDLKVDVIISNFAAQHGNLLQLIEDGFSLLNEGGEMLVLMPITSVYGYETNSPGDIVSSLKEMFMLHQLLNRGKSKAPIGDMITGLVSFTKTMANSGASMNFLKSQGYKMIQGVQSKPEAMRQNNRSNLLNIQTFLSRQGIRMDLDWKALFPNQQMPNGHIFHNMALIKFTKDSATQTVRFEE